MEIAEIRPTSQRPPERSAWCPSAYQASSAGYVSTHCPAGCAAGGSLPSRRHASGGLTGAPDGPRPSTSSDSGLPSFRKDEQPRAATGAGFYTMTSSLHDLPRPSPARNRLWVTRHYHSSSSSDIVHRRGSPVAAIVLPRSFSTVIPARHLSAVRSELRTTTVVLSAVGGRIVVVSSASAWPFGRLPRDRKRRRRLDFFGYNMPAMRRPGTGCHIGASINRVSPRWQW